MDVSNFLNYTPNYEMSMNDRKHYLKEEIKDALGELLADFQEQFKDECLELGVNLELVVGVQFVPIQKQKA